MGRIAMWGRLAGALFGAGLLLASGVAQALSFTLDVEFDERILGDFVRVEVVEQGTGLRFELTVLEALGSDADLHRFYFNLEGEIPDLRIESEDDVTTAYVLSEAPPVAGGAGSRFDYGVSFGNGAGERGNGVLQSASFVIAPVDPMRSLGLDAFWNAELSSASGGSIEALAAAHLQGTTLFPEASSETVGGVVPEPSTGLLLLGGVLLAVNHRR